MSGLTVAEGEQIADATARGDVDRMRAIIVAQANQVIALRKEVEELRANPRTQANKSINAFANAVFAMGSTFPEFESMSRDRKFLVETDDQGDYLLGDLVETITVRMRAPK